MSKFYYMASDFELPEVDYTGIEKISLKEISRLNLPLQFPNWLPQDEINGLDEDLEVLYATDESDWDALCISRCDTLPYEVDPYIKRDYIYNLSGNMDGKALMQLITYLKENINGKDVALWSLWLGDEFPYIMPRKNIDLHNIDQEYDKLKSFMEMDYCSIQIQG